MLEMVLHNLLMELEKFYQSIPQSQESEHYHRPEKIQKQIFNVGNENLTISAIAEVVRKVVLRNFPEKTDLEVVQSPSDDNRSYHINSDKIERVLGFRATRTVEDAAQELCEAFKNGLLPNSLTDEKYFNVKTLKGMAIK